MLRKVGVNPSSDVASDIQPCENPFMREIVVGDEVKLVPDSHPISRDLSADSFSIEALDDAGLNKKSERPFVRSTFEERLQNLEMKLSQRAAYVAGQRASEPAPDFNEPNVSSNPE